MSNIVALPNETREDAYTAGAAEIYAERAGKAFERVMRLSGRVSPLQAVKALSAITNLLELAEQALTVTGAAEELRT